jgi:hypothetical protein
LILIGQVGSSPSLLKEPEKGYPSSFHELRRPMLPGPSFLRLVRDSDGF